jgi:hypothetical protein
MKIDLKSLTVFGILLFIIIIGCEKPTEPKQPTNPLIGIWAETFLWNSYQYQYGEYTKTSTINFTVNNFMLKILPPYRMILFEKDSFYVGYSPDTLYTGFYITTKDTIFFNVDDKDFSIKMNFYVTNESLYVNVIPEPGPEGSMCIQLGVFLWDNCDGKRSGTFIKQK